MPEKAYLLSFENGSGKMAENRQGFRNPGLFFIRRPVQMKYATKVAHGSRASRGREIFSTQLHMASGFISDRLGDRMLIRVGIAIEFAGILLIALPFKGYVPAAAGFLIVGYGADIRGKFYLYVISLRHTADVSSTL